MTDFSAVAQQDNTNAAQAETTQNHTAKRKRPLPSMQRVVSKTNDVLPLQIDTPASNASIQVSADSRKRVSADRDTGSSTDTETEKARAVTRVE